ncbi:MAG: glycosyltransferase family 4 protein, partial [Sulfolobales archaeon]
MNILYLTPRYYPHVGGIEYVVKSVAERLAKQGHNVTVLCGETGINVPREEWVNGVHVVRWPVWSPGDAYHIPKMRNRLARWLLGIGNKCDVIHLHSVHGILPMYSLRVLRSSSVRKVLTPHYHGTGHTLFRSILWILWRRLVSRLIKSVDVIHCVSNHEANLVRRSLKIGCTVIEHGVDEQIKSLEWKPEDYALYAGRIEWYKNIERLARII